jgi:hypothetical protein
MISCAIDSKEGRDVATSDIPGAFMQADMDEIVHMRVVVKMVDILSQINPLVYKPFIVYENSVQVIYVLLNKALYGTINAALMFWRKLTNQLIEWGFKINPYDCCGANKDFNGK